ncbi:thioesterase domain-containing protein, partial [Pantoea sp. GbtcB22]|uniref:thioesterase domain-containing protein n=1 Tax=Pantoea sp. GbtcB22 TaxID=2824767 RepID=UPI001C2F77B2
WFIHPTGGAVWCYKDLAEKVLAGILSSYGIECVPEASTGKFVNNLNVMAERYCLDILDREQSEYYTVVGYSFGGNVAYEICRL